MFKYCKIKYKAQIKGEAIIQNAMSEGRGPLSWTPFENRSLIRLNRICEGYKPFISDKENIRWIGLCPELPTSLEKFGNI